MRTSPSNEETQVASSEVSEPPGGAGRKQLSRGDTVGRYMILDRLGGGGMGVVYAAYDPELDRKLAVKLLRDAPGPVASTEGRARLIREARAMAKLQHPNVITVHDVGEFAGDVFVAMEFVDGVTLKEWLEARARPWKEVLEVFRKAGAGVAAAHRKGLIHRDFKPDNVMIGRDGRVRVLDFGLARGRGEGEPRLLSADSAAGDVLNSELTLAGSVIGTPAYMSPEQHDGGEVDARSDQFSFCVALHEGLYTQRPFAGDTPIAIAASVSFGEVQAPPAGRRVPRWLRTIVLRGLAREPEQRFASMQDLLRALDRDPTRRRWQVGSLLGVVAIAGGLYGGHEVLEARRDAACAREGQSIAEVWNAERRAVLRTSMRVDTVSYGPLAFDHAARWLDEKASGWDAAKVQQCIGARADVQGADAQRACLDERREEFSQLISMLESEGPAALSSAIQTTAALTPAGRCLDPQWLERHQALPEDPEIRGAVASVRRQIAESRTLGKLGRSEDAVVRAKAALVDAEDTGWLPIVAAAQLTLGVELERDGKAEDAMPHLRSSFLAAAEAGDEVVLVQAGGMLAFAAGYRLSDAPAAELWREISGAMMRQAGLVNDLIGASWRQSIAATYFATGDYATMREHYEAAEATRTRLLGADHPATLSSRAAVGTALFQLGDYASARDILEPTIGALSQTLGPDHPSLSGPLGTLASVCGRLGDADAAREHTGRALRIARAAHGPEHVATARAMVNHANTLEDQEERLRLNQAALPILRTSLGAEHPAVAGVMSNVALAHRKVGNLEQATEILRRSLEAHAENPGREHPKTAMIMVNLGEVHFAAARWDDAEALFEEALAVQGERLGEDHPDTAKTRFRLAQARWEQAESPAERADALALGRDARAGLSVNDSAGLSASLETWLEEHGDQPDGPQAR